MTSPGMNDNSSDSKVQVAVRVRPFNRREVELETQCIVQVNGQQIVLQNPTTTSNIPTSISSNSNRSKDSGTNDHHHPSGSSSTTTTNTSSSSNNNSSSNSNNNNNNNSLSRTTVSRNCKQFAFDHCFWSFSESDPHFASQEQVYKDLGLPVLESSFQGYNACIFAYGQTGSGKSYTMLGSARDKGLIPRLCDGIFERIHVEEADGKTSFKVEVSYMEIYNERVHDLLDPKGIKANLRVREHNILGPYVDGLSKLAVSSFEQIDNLMSEGNKSRTVAATNMNSESSRSHAVFTITLTCSTFDEASGVTGEKVSKMSLVDLAGSERAVKTGAVGDRLKEGSNINKSLTTLGLVISKLADSASGKSSGKEQFVPYRDSVLTWLLKDNLGGNSKTVMVATISPAADNFEESLSTLRYADRAKRIVNHAVVNEDPNARMIRELREEVDVLREQLKNATQSDVLKERLQESEKLIKEMTLTWEERLRQTELIHQERQKELEKMGISVQSSGIRVQTDKYYLVNLNSDPSMNELLVYYLKDVTLVGRSDAKKEQDIQLSGIGIQEEHAVIEIDKNNLFMVPLNHARTCVNGSVIRERTLLSHGDRILWGNNHFFKVSCPKRSHHVTGTTSTEFISSKSDDSVKSGYTSFSEIRNSDSPHDPYHVQGHHPHEHDMITSRDNNYSPEDNEYSSIDFDFAREELMMKELSNDPLQTTVLKSLEKQHEEDKKIALEKQKEMYEKQLQLLRNQISPSAPYATPVTSSNLMGSSSMLLQSMDSLGSSTRLNALVHGHGSNSSSGVQSKMDKWAQERDELFRKSLAQLKEDIVRANTLVLEANAFSQEMGRNTEFKVTLQIPAANLSPNRKKGAFVSEPAILVKRKNKASQVWSMEKMENKLIDMRELYASWKSCTSHSDDDKIMTQSDSNRKSDPFFESQETHHLIGVASIFLDVLFHDVVLDYQVPIISQQGEVAGRLQVEISRIGGQMGERFADAGDDDANENTSQPSPDMMSSASPTDDSSQKDDTNNSNSRNSSPDDMYSSRNQVAVRVKLKAARGLPIALSNYVFCQYSFWGSSDAVVAPAKSNSDRRDQGHTMPDEENGISIINFDHVKEFIVSLSEEFLEHCTEGALAIEVWGHRSAGFTSARHSGWEVLAQTQIAEVNKSLSDRWAELKRKIEFWIEIQELNENGEYTAVEVTSRENNHTGGVYQLRQGQQRRILVKVNPFPGDSGTLPLICEAITGVAIGAVQVRSRTSTELDSYQEDDLRRLKEKWKDALDRRRIYLRDQMLQLDSKVNKTEEDEERGKNLLDQWVNLLEEERTLDDPHSEIPGADPSDAPCRGMEQHSPVIFLDLSPDDMSMSTRHDSLIAGLNLILPKEHNASFFNLPIIRYNDKDVSVIAAWDSSIHDTPALNRASSPDERISLIVRASVRLSHPAVVDLILRKRISINVYKRQSITDRIKKKILPVNAITATGVVYEIVSSIPKESEEVEDRESLALVAAASAQNDSNVISSLDGESYIEKYTKGVSAVESILALDKLRQEVAIRELIAASANPNAHVAPVTGMSASTSSSSYDYVRKTLSVPNFGILAGATGSNPRLYDGINVNNVRSEFGSNFDISALLAKAGNLFVGSNAASTSGTASPSSMSSSMSYNATSDRISANVSAPSSSSSSAHHSGNPSSESPASNRPISAASPSISSATLSPAKSVKPMKTVIESEDTDDTGP